MARRNITYEQMVKDVVARDAREWVKGLLEQNDSKYSMVCVSQEGQGVWLDYMPFPAVLDAADGAARISYDTAIYNGYHYMVCLDIWSGCPLKVDTVYVYGVICGGSGRIERDMILDDKMGRLVWWGVDCDKNHNTVKAWHGVEDFRFWSVPPYVEESGVTNEDLLDMNEPCWSW